MCSLLVLSLEVHCFYLRPEHGLHFSDYTGL